MDMGLRVEHDLYELLSFRFGKNCVFLSPKFSKAGIEKEVCDILILTLPYAIAFQIKWMKLTSEELFGDKADIKKERMIRRMRNAADQFSEICSNISHAQNVELSMNWDDGSVETFVLPMDKIEHLVPVVIIDFEDKDYSNPDKRYCDIPPVIIDAGKQAQKYGKIHSFLKADFKRIVEQLFSVGDFMLWLFEREKMFGSKAKVFIGYNEMTMFYLYLANNPLFKKICNNDCVWIGDNDIFENETNKFKDEFEKRRILFGSKNIIDKIEEQLTFAINRQSDSELRNEKIINYIALISRFKRLSSLMRVVMSDKLKTSLKEFHHDNEKLSIRGTYSIFDEGAVCSTLYYLGVADFSSENAEPLCEYSYMRSISNAKRMGRLDQIKEVFVVILRKDRLDLLVHLFYVEDEDRLKVLEDDELMKTQPSVSYGHWKMSEWSFIKKEYATPN